MKRFLKKNISFVVFLSISGVVALVLLVLALIEHAGYRNAFNQLVRLRNQIGDLNKQHPSPVPENLELIEKDTEVFEDKVTRMQHYFGHPYQPALDAFAKELGVDLDEFTAKFRELWSEKREAGSPGVHIFRQFKTSGGWEVEEEEDGESVDSNAAPKMKWTVEQWDKAMEKFKTIAQSATVEKITEGNVDDIFMAAIGVLRGFNGSSTEFDVHSMAIRSELSRLFDEKEIGLAYGADTFEIAEPASLSGSGSMMSGPMGMGAMGPMGAGGGATGGGTTATRGGAAGMGFGGLGIEPVDPAEELGQKARIVEIIGDLGRRLAGTGIDSLDYFYNTDLLGNTESDYTYYRFDFDVTGSMETKRRLAEVLHDAYKDNRMYIVRHMNMEKIDDDVQGIIDATLRLRDQELRLRENPMLTTQGNNRMPMTMPNATPTRRGSGDPMSRTSTNAPVRSGLSERPARNSRGTGPTGGGMPSMMGGGMPGGGNSNKDAMWEERIVYWMNLLPENRFEEGLAFDKRKNYGMPMIGGNRRLRAMIAVEYVVYNAEEELK